MSFYLRHIAGFFIQFGAGILLCLLPYGADSFRLPYKRVIIANVLLAVLSSVLFPFFISLKWITGTPYQALAANMYMTAAILIFMVLYFRSLKVEMVKKLVVLVLALFYSATQYMLVGIIESIHPSDVQWEVYLPIDFLLYAITAALMLPPSALLMRRVVREYLVEIETESIRKEFRIVLGDIKCR